MPKSNLVLDKVQKRYDYVAGILTGGLRQRNIDKKYICSKTGIPERTVYNRLEHPENMKLRELYQLADLAGVSIRFEQKEIPE